MSELGDDFKFLKEHKRREKSQRLLRNLEKLQEMGILYRQLSSTHYRIYLKDDRDVDFWPSTGYWKFLNGEKRGWQLKNLIGYITGDYPNEY